MISLDNVWTAEVFGAGAEADEERGNLSQNWKRFQQTKHDRQ